MRALLDVNVLIALLDADHLHHFLATSWFAAEQKSGWATCPLTQNGCVRIMAQPAYRGSFSLPQVAERLANLSGGPNHRFWPARLDLLNQQHFDLSALTGHRQITDAYLLALAVKNGGCFVTFDRGVALGGVVGAQSRHITVLL